MLAVPVAAEPGQYLLWFRPERVKTVTWGGDPTKPVIVGTDPAQLSPRLSFAQWHQVVEGTSDPWTRADRGTAKLIGKTIADVVGALPIGQHVDRARPARHDRRGDAPLARCR